MPTPPSGPHDRDLLRSPCRGPLALTEDELRLVGRALGNLTPQQLKVLDGLARWLVPKEIAAELHLSVPTVRRYITTMTDRARLHGGARGLLLEVDAVLRYRREQQGLTREDKFPEKAATHYRT